MSQYLSVEVSGEMIADLMAEDANFAGEMLKVLAIRVNMGALRDDAADICAGMSPEDAAFISNQFIILGEAMKAGFNMAHIDQLI